jgi:hypothetical protein
MEYDEIPVSGSQIFEQNINFCLSKTHPKFQEADSSASQFEHFFNKTPASAVADQELLIPLN